MMSSLRLALIYPRHKSVLLLHSLIMYGTVRAGKWSYGISQVPPSSIPKRPQNKIMHISYRTILFSSTLPFIMWPDVYHSHEFINQTHFDICTNLWSSSNTAHQRYEEV